MSQMQSRARAAGARAPGCPQCGGYLKTATVLFGEQLPKDKTSAACDLMQACDGLLIVGTSLNVFPAAKYALCTILLFASFTCCAFPTLLPPCPPPPQLTTHRRYPGLVRGLISPSSLTNTGGSELFASSLAPGPGGRGGGGMGGRSGLDGMPRHGHSGPPAPIVEVNAMSATSPALPDVMLTGRAGEWLPRLVARLIAQSGHAPGASPAPAKANAKAPPTAPRPAVTPPVPPAGKEDTNSSAAAALSAAAAADALASKERKRQALARMAGVDLEAVSLT